MRSAPAPPELFTATEARWPRQSRAHGGGALPRSHLTPEAGGRQPAGHQGTEALPARRRPEPRHVPAAAPRMRAPASANYRVPELRTVHPRPGQARAPRASPSEGSGPSLMFPRPGRPVGSAQPAPGRTRASRLAVGAQPGAQRSPCVRRGGPDGASGLGAPGGDAHSFHFRSPMSRPARPPAPERTGRRRGWQRRGTGARAGPTPAGTRPGCGRGRGDGRMQLPTVVMAVAAASPRDPDGRKRKCRPGARARRLSPRRFPAAACTSHGLLHGELEPARGLCLLPVSRPALPPTARLTPLARRLESSGGAGGARPRHCGRWGPPLAGSLPASTT